MESPSVHAKINKIRLVVEKKVIKCQFKLFARQQKRLRNKQRIDGLKNKDR
jgi:hypothetical protein